jgi:hypothetical protein
VRPQASHRDPRVLRLEQALGDFARLPGVDPETAGG